MGVIIRQSFWNMSTTYAGFALGAVNTLFLYTNFMSKEDTGLVLSLVSLSAILMPFIAVGMNNALIRFLPLEKDKDSLLSFTLAVPAFVFIVLGTVVYTKADWLKNFFEQGAVLADFVPLAFWIAVFSAFFEVFYGYAQAHMRSTEGVFLRELFYRISTTVLLFAVYLGWVNVTWFCYLLTASFALRLGIMMFVAYRCRPFRLEKFVFGKYRKVIAYGLFSSMGMAIWAALLEFDKTMLPFYEDLSMVASYAIASFIGMTVAVPYRSLYQIANPILAKAIADGDVARQKELSFKSSINSMILCGGLFLLINCNIEQIYNLLPKNLRSPGIGSSADKSGKTIRRRIGTRRFVHRLFEILPVGPVLFRMPYGIGDRLQPLFHTALGHKRRCNGYINIAYSDKCPENRVRVFKNRTFSVPEQFSCNGSYDRSILFCIFRLAHRPSVRRGRYSGIHNSEIGAYNDAIRIRNIKTKDFAGT